MVICAYHGSQSFIRSARKTIDIQLRHLQNCAILPPTPSGFRTDLVGGLVNVINGIMIWGKKKLQQQS